MQKVQQNLLKLTGLIYWAVTGTSFSGYGSATNGIDFGSNVPACIN